MGLFKRKPSVDPAEVAALRAELADVRSRLEASEAIKTDLESRVLRLDLAAAANASSAEQASAQMAQQIAELREQIDATASQAHAIHALEERLHGTANDTASTRELVGLLEARLAQVSTELANQLAELGREMDALSAHAENGDARESTDEAAVERLRDGQVRLANEQARYEIAFREDLATLAEQVRLLRGR
jgi:chromosome segregation ATPase